jgi:predicted metal-dependent hydrolase
MMPVLVIGDTHIPYTVRYSDRAGRKRIVVTPEGVEVVAPAGAPHQGADGIIAYVERKRRWIFTSVLEINEKHRKLLTQQYASGAKLQYRGRWLMIDLQPAAVDEVQIECRSKLHVAVPSDLEGVDRLAAVRLGFDHWLRERALRDLLRFGRRHERNLGVSADGYRLSESRRSWGTCGKDRVIRIHWRLIQAPAAAMEYVVAHEVAHLVHRHHSPELWRLVSQTLPSWQEQRLMLEQWETDHRAV